MKKFFSLLTAISFFAICSEAQVVDNNPMRKNRGEFCFQQVPAEFTTDGQLQVWMVNLFEENRNSSYPDRGVASLIDEDLNEKKQVEINGYPLTFKDLNQPYASDFGFYLSQTLFNSDSKYEIIEGVMTTKSDDYLEGYLFLTGFKIVSEGTVLQTVNFPNGIESDGYGFYPTIIKIGSKLYLYIDGLTDNNGNYYELVYKINSAASNVSLVRQDYVGKTRKIYNNGRFLIENAEGKLYRTDGVEAVSE
ncbi:MAG: hypothetical protein KBT20_03330 [Bacteroidales bacterium]|nr:hypothetical protein [Candidatus Liminaster caballi]